MIYTYDPLDTACKSRIGAFACGNEITFRIYKITSGEVSFSAENCNMHVCRDGEEIVIYPMQKTEYGFAITLKFNRTGLYFYYFKLGEYYLSCGAMRKGVLSEKPWSWQLTVFSQDYQTPEWFKGGIIYQIFPDRFFKEGQLAVPGKILRDDWGGTPTFRPNMYGKVMNNDFFGGNLNGIRAKLDYLHELGVTVIYLNPIFEAYSNHRYDTGDYMKIDPLLGTEEDFDNLIAEAAAHGIRIILDGVFNHTGDNSRYFNKFGSYNEVGAYQSEASLYHDWYCFRRFPDEYESWWGIETMPAVNESSPSYQNFIFGKGGVLKHWLRHGIAGYRLDVADELPDFFLQKLRKAVKDEKKDAVIIGEVWEDASNKIAYGVRREYFQGSELDSVMNYPLKDGIIDYALSGNTSKLRETIAMLLDNYPKDALDSLMNILGTHDTARIITVLSGKTCNNKEEMALAKLSEEECAAAIKKLKIAAFLQFTLPGVPSIYYGDENGMQGYSDPFCRRCFDWEHQNTELHAFYKKLGEIRTEIFHNVFKDGVYREIFADNSCLVFERRTNNQAVYIYVNNGTRDYNITLKGQYREYLSGKTFHDKLVIGSYSYGILADKQYYA